MADRIGVDMTDCDFVLKWAHLGRGRPRPLRHREIIEAERRAFEAHVAEIQAEQPTDGLGWLPEGTDRTAGLTLRVR